MFPDELRHLLRPATLLATCTVMALAPLPASHAGDVMLLSPLARGGLVAQVPPIAWRPDPAADRNELALGYLRVELALTEADERELLGSGDERRDLNRSFDEITLSYFSGEVDRALEGLARMVARLAMTLGAEADRWDAVADSILERLGAETEVVEIDGRSIRYLVHLPEGESPPGGWPVVLALHGAGGDERMFFGGYGAGSIRSLASERRLAVVTPGGVASPDELLQLLEHLAGSLPIDPGRLALLGHSMGAGVAARAGEAYPERVRAVVCIAGSCGSTRPGLETPPIWLAAGEIDPVSRAPVLDAQARAMTELGRDVTFMLRSDEGHTLIVGTLLPDALDWVMERLRIEHGPDR